MLTQYLFLLHFVRSWAKFAAGWTVGGLSGVAWCYILTQLLPYYS
jgi:hypothetical protein